MDEAIKRMKEIAKLGDAEYAHGQADALLCDVLVELGYGELVEEFKKVIKWYS